MGPCPPLPIDAARPTDGREARTARFRVRIGTEDHPVPPSGLVIGRATDCTVQLGTGLVSRHHARICETAEGLMVEDLGSRNGVLVNQRKIAAPTLLAHGDQIGIGLETFEVIDEHVLSRPAHLSTMPPPSGPVVAPAGEADVDAPEQMTVTARLDVLSQREREVLELIVLGHTQREIAERLFVSVKTIETHRAHIAEKLGCKTRAELVTYALSAGLLGGLLRTR